MLTPIRFIVQGHGSPAPIPVAIDRGSEVVAGTGLLPEFRAEYALRRMSKKSAPVKATGGGGYTFADKVAAGFLAQMLRRKFPLEPDLGPIAELHFETLDAGHVLDDLQFTLKRGMDATRCLVSVVIGSGQRPVRYELVFEDPILGVLPLDDTLTIEIWRMRGPLSRQKWQMTDVRGLYAELILSGGIDVVGAGEGEKATC